MFGPPGTGKTLLAKAIPHHDTILMIYTGVPLFREGKLPNEGHVGTLNWVRGIEGSGPGCWGFSKCGALREPEDMQGLQRDVTAHRIVQLRQGCFSELFMWVCANWIVVYPQRSTKQQGGVFSASQYWSEVCTLSALFKGRSRGAISMLHKLPKS